MSRIRNSWELAKVSWGVLRSDKSLAAFPVISAIVTLIVIGIFAGLIGLTGVDSDHGQEGLKAIGYVFVVVGYIVLAFVTTYFTAALVAGANEVLNGRRAALGESFAAANAKLHRLLPWAFVQGTVSIIIQALEERLGVFGQIIARLLGAAWAVLTFLTIPIIMLEDLGPWNALKRSGHLLKQTWGENIVAQLGFGILALVASLPGLAIIAIGVATGSVAAAVAIGIVGAIWVAIVAVVISAMSGIYRTALYRYAVDGQAPGPFAGVDMAHAFGPRRRRDQQDGGMLPGTPSTN
jgi:hypothetical protein